MSKQEFIDKLTIALNGRVTPNLVQENVNYYEEYINTKIRMGRSESEVLDTLGDPRLIAKTIIETSGQGTADTYNGTDHQKEGHRNAGYHNTEYQRTTNKMFRMPGWLWAIIVVLVLVFILSLVFSVLSFLAPILIPILVVLFLVKLFRDWLN